MKVVKTYADGTRTVVFEVGDRVYFSRPYKQYLTTGTSIPASTKATVLGRSHTWGTDTLDFLNVQLDSQDHNSFFLQVSGVPPWFLEIVEEQETK